MNFRIIAFLQNFEFEFNFSNSPNFEIFLEKVSKIMKNFPYFSVNFFFKLFVSNQRKKFYKMATFRVEDHIFFICSLKNHMTFFGDYWSKIFWKFSSFLVQNFQTYFSGIISWKYRECHLTSFKYALVLFLRFDLYSES